VLSALSLDILVRILVLSSGVLQNQPNPSSHNHLWEAVAAPKLLFLSYDMTPHGHYFPRLTYQSQPNMVTREPAKAES